MEAFEIHRVFHGDAAFTHMHVALRMQAECAALDAVKQWRYQPTLLNGDPVEVDTEIDVIFSLAS